VVKFTGDGNRLLRAVQLPPGEGPRVNDGWRFWAIGLWAKSSGCYAIQVDGVGFSDVILSEIRIARRRAPV
jgi:hypothetical protein